MRNGITAKEIKTTVGGGALQYPVTVPAETPVRWYQGGQNGQWLVERGFDSIEGCETGSIARWDAEHRGIVIRDEDVIEEVGTD